MPSNRSALPSAGDIINFFFTACGLSKGKSVDHGYKRIQRLLSQTKQAETLSEEVRQALFDAICGLFTLPGEPRASTLLTGAPESHTRRILAFRHAFGSVEPHDFGYCLLYLLGEFLLRNEWFCQQQDAETDLNGLRWKWVDWANVFCTNTLGDFATYAGGLRQCLPWDVSWNLPLRKADGTIEWPIGHALTWWEDLLGESLSGRELEAHEIVSARTLRRYRNGETMPPLDTIELWSKHAWRYRGVFNSARETDVRKRWAMWLAFSKKKKLNPTTLYGAVGPMSGVQPEQWLRISDPFREELPVAEFLDRVEARYAAPSGRRLRAVLLWCRALQSACTAVAERYSVDAMFKLTDWSRQCTDSLARFEVFQREYAALSDEEKGWGFKLSPPPES